MSGTIHPLDHLVLRGRAEAPALLLRDETLDYQALRERIGALAGWLKSRVDRPGARIAGWIAKGEAACLLPLACARAGLVHVPVNPLLKRAQLAHILADSDAAMLIATASRLATLEVGDVPAACVVLTEAEAMATMRSATPLPPSDADPGQLAAILYTSGSTGRPKGVMLSHANLWLGAESVVTYLGLGEHDRVLAVLPFAFDYGQNQLLSGWYAGASVVPLDYLAPRDVIKAVARHAITTLAAVPPLWLRLAELDWPEAAVNSLMRLTNSGGALTESLVRQLRARFPAARLFAMYGLTEAFRSTFLDPALIDSCPASIGTAIPHAEVLVVRDDGSVADAGEEGEIVHCGPLVAQGYWRDEERTAQRFRPAPAASHYGGIAVWSGDRAWVDARGLLFFVGRRDAMIKSSGNRISPQEVEDAALATGLVAEAVALGLPDPGLGQAVHLVVRPAADMASVAPDQAPDQALMQALSRELPGFMCPRVIHWRDHLPLGPNGKIDREGLARDVQGMTAP